MKSAPKRISPRVAVTLQPPEISSAVTEYSVVATDFVRKPLKKSRAAEAQKHEIAEDDFLIIGFDTEYQIPDDPVTKVEVEAGTARYTVLSYQFSVIHGPEAKWSGIAIPPSGTRLSMGELIILALGSRPSKWSTKFPRLIYLVGHYTKADVPAFSDFKDIKQVVSAVRGSFVTVDMDTSLLLDFPEDDDVELQIKFRDTYLLSPTGSQALASLGEMVGIPKIPLDPDPAKDRDMKSRMFELRATNWPLFKSYAIEDAVICAEYASRIIQLCKEHLGKPILPITLTSIGVDMLLNTWHSADISADEILGREKSSEMKFNKTRGHMMKVTSTVPTINYDLFENLATECYHGGRNEQFWFGPAFEDAWTDFDLASAYGTAMALIGKPDWSNVDPTRDLDRFGLDTLGYALVEFEFPSNVRFPSLPVRTDHGLIFPRKGVSFCAAPELFVAKELGASLTIKQGVVVASDPTKRVFGNYITHCIAERRKHAKKSLSELFWKELSNSTYGKTAQGLREKRVYDSRDMETKPLPPSKITNPYFAAYITSFVRAVLGEILNALPDQTCVFSCTTDGFLTNASESQIAAAQQGPAAKTFSEARTLLTSDPQVLEIKHTVRYPLGWRTRGQATLVPGRLPEESAVMNTVLAKGGIRLAERHDSVADENDAIVRLFFARTPETKITFESLLGIRDIVENDADLVRKELSRRVNMEFDWKRKPDLLFDSMDYEHVAFSTAPWENVDQFNQIREYFDQYQDKTPVCIKSVSDFDGFSYYVDMKNKVSPSDSAYLPTVRGDIGRLRQMLCSAWHAEACGVRSSHSITTASQFAEALTTSGIKCEVQHVQNGKKKVFAAGTVPATDRAIAAASKLKARIPEFDPTLLWSGYVGVLDALPYRRPYEPDWDTASMPSDLSWMIELARRQPGDWIKSQFEMPRDKLRERVPYWMR